MTDDIVKQLREFDIFTSEIGTPWHPPICDKAADEIDRLRVDKEELQLSVVRLRAMVLKREDEINLLRKMILKGGIK